MQINGQQNKWNIVYEVKPVRILYTQQFLYWLQFVQLNTLSDNQMLLVEPICKAYQKLLRSFKFDISKQQ